MKLFLGLLIILMSIIISGVAAYFSVYGLMALFAAAAIPVAIMGVVLEAGKLLMAAVLHANWKNPKFKWPLKSFLGLCIGLLMIINALGVYGYLSRGHLEQEAPKAGIELQISQLETQKNNIVEDNKRLNDKIALLDKSIETFLKNDKASQGEAARTKQKIEREQLEKSIQANNEKINKINDEILPFKQKNADVEAKLGPVKYVSKLFGVEPEYAVIIIIVLLIVAFDPFAIAMVIAGSIKLEEYFEDKKKKVSKQEINQFEQTINSLKLSLEDKNNEIKTLIDNLNEIKEEKTKYSNLLNERSIEIAELQDKIKEYDKNIDVFSQEFNDKDSLNEKLENYSNEINTLKNNINDLDKIILEKDDQIEKLEDQVNRMNSVTLLQELQSMDATLRKEQIIQILENNPTVVEEIVNIAKEIQLTPGGDRISKGKI
jgi:predicted  nucleic acid-binding Zn-ribbon protein